MADIKGLDIFGNNRGLERIKKEVEAKKKQNKQTFALKTADSTETSSISKKKQVALKTEKKTFSKVGAPIRKFDKVYKHPLKLSTLLNATSRVLVEKYETNMTRDGLLKKSIGWIYQAEFDTRK